MLRNMSQISEQSTNKQNKNWMYAPEKLITGQVSFLLKFLGQTEVCKDGESDNLKEAIAKLERGNTGIKVPNVRVSISIGGISIQSKRIQYNFSLNKVTYCLHERVPSGKKAAKMFSIIVKETNSEKLRCFVFLSSEQAKVVEMTVRQAKELAHLVNTAETEEDVDNNDDSEDRDCSMDSVSSDSTSSDSEDNNGDTTNNTNILGAITTNKRHSQQGTTTNAAISDRSSSFPVANTSSNNFKTSSKLRSSPPPGFSMPPPLIPPGLGEAVYLNLIAGAAAAVPSNLNYYSPTIPANGQSQLHNNTVDRHSSHPEIRRSHPEFRRSYPELKSHPGSPHPSSVAPRMARGVVTRNFEATNPPISRQLNPLVTPFVPRKEPILSYTNYNTNQSVGTSSYLQSHKTGFDPQSTASMASNQGTRHNSYVSPSNNYILNEDSQQMSNMCMNNNGPMKDIWSTWEGFSRPVVSFGYGSFGFGNFSICQV